MPEPVRLLMALTVRFGKNGITNSVMNYISRFDPARIRCDLATLNEPGEEARAAVARTGGEVFILSGRNRNPISHVRALRAIVKDRREEIVHAHGNSATLYAEMLAAKRGGAAVRIPHSHNTACRMKAADKLLRGLFYKSYTHALACSGAAGDWLYPHRPFVVLNNAIDTERFRFDARARTGERDQLGIDPDAFVYLHIGAFNEQKNQAFLLEAFEMLSRQRADARLLLAGDGERKASCEARAEALGIRNKVLFLGLRDDIPALLSAADAFVLPSLHEGLPLTMVEAQCAGLPCLVSERVTREASLTPLVSFAPIDRAETFAERMAGLRREERAAASADAVRRAEDAGYDSSKNALWLMDYYENQTRGERVTRGVKNI